MRNLSIFIMSMCVAMSFGFIFDRTGCFCTCTDGKTCIKAAVTWFDDLIDSQNPCQCRNGTCPLGSVYNGKLINEIASLSIEK